MPKNEEGSSSSRRKARTSALQSRNVGRDLSSTPERGSTGKSAYQQQQVALTPASSPIARLSKVAPKDLSSKVDAPNAGDHSPSVSAVNRTPDKAHGISGRSSYKGQYGLTTGERDVPTLQFNTRDFNNSQDARDPNKGSAAHTMYTSLREMHGTGERHSISSHSDLLDATRQSYSPYNAKGEVERGGVAPFRVNVHSESKSGPELHRSNTGVDPMVGQSMINLHYRDPNFLKRGMPDKVRESHQKAAAMQEQSAPAPTPSTAMTSPTVHPQPSAPQPSHPPPSHLPPSQQGLLGVQHAVQGVKRSRSGASSHNSRPHKQQRTTSQTLNQRPVKRQRSDQTDHNSGPTKQHKPQG